MCPKSETEFGSHEMVYTDLASDTGYILGLLVIIKSLLICLFIYIVVFYVSTHSYEV